MSSLHARLKCNTKSNRTAKGKRLRCACIGNRAYGLPSGPYEQCYFGGSDAYPPRSAECIG